MNIKTTGLKVKCDVKAAGYSTNHNRTVAGLKVKSNMKAAGYSTNHNRALTVA